MLLVLKAEYKRQKGELLRNGIETESEIPWLDVQDDEPPLV
jgi:hypothetical protein